MAVIKLGNLWNKRQKNRKYSKWRIRNGKYTKWRINQMKYMQNGRFKIEDTQKEGFIKWRIPKIENMQIGGYTKWRIIRKENI